VVVYHLATSRMQYLGNESSTSQTIMSNRLVVSTTCSHIDLATKMCCRSGNRPSNRRWWKVLLYMIPETLLALKI
jgi:hypothetical protein